MVETAILTQQALTFADAGIDGLYVWQNIPALFSLTAGENYAVEWNGNRYICVAQSGSFSGMEGVGIGNFALAGLGENTNEPFLFGEPLDGSFSACYTTEQNATNTVAIYHVAEEETPDKEYLIWGSTMKAIGNAIREKTGGTAALSPGDMPAEIRSITGGSSSAPEVVYITFMSHDGATELYKKPVIPGDDSRDPVTSGLIGTPTRVSSNTENFTFSGWAATSGGAASSSVLDEVTEDRTVYAAYTASTRYYTVRFFDGETLLNTMQVAYGAAANYTPTKEGYQFDSWSPSNINITADTDCYAQWSERLTFANATWEQIAEISEAGEAQNYFAVGDTKQVAYENDVFTVAIAGFDHDDLADGTGKAGISIVCTTVPAVMSAWSNGATVMRYYYYDGIYQCYPRRDTMPIILDNLPPELTAVIKPVTKMYETSNESGETPATATITDSIWLLSVDELGYDWTDAYATASGISRLGSRYPLFKEANIFDTAGKLDPVYVGSTSTVADYWTRNLSRGILNAVVYIYGVADRMATQGSSKSLTTERYIRFGFCI